MIVPQPLDPLAFLDPVMQASLHTLIAYSGPVFSRQKAHTVATGGVIWSVMLLNAMASLTSLIAILLILVGLLPVAKKADFQELIERSIQA